MSTPTTALASALGRDWRLEILTAPNTWTQVRGLSSVGPIFEGSEEDDSDIDSGGFASQIVTGLAFRIEGSGKRKGETTAGFVDDAGQNFLRRKGRKTGVDNTVTARIFRRDELPDAYEADTTVKWTDNAPGSTNALQEFSFTLSGRGAPRDIVKPLVPSTAQSFTVALGSPTAGNFTLTWAGKTTATIAHNAASSAVLAALAALDDGYAAGDFTVTGSAGGPYSITVPGGVLTGNGASLTGGTLTVTTA